MKNTIKNSSQKIMAKIRASVRDDNLRQNMMFRWLNLLLSLVAFTMTAVNIVTKEYYLMFSTLVFAVLCLINVFLSRRQTPRARAEFLLFAAESYILLAFFFISGIPNGFSALWACLIPSFALLIFGRRIGSIYSLLTFLGIIFLFWTPTGHSLLLYRYTDEFLLRFPFFYAACFMIALFLEFIRAETQTQLLDSRAEYEYLYRHDALTGLYNRYGFYQKVNLACENPSSEKMAILIMDIDDFKLVNDRHGHVGGDKVLKHVAGIIQDTVCEHTIYCRWGGEEFTVFFHCEHNYLEIAEALRKQIEAAEICFEGQPIHITVSGGICMADSMDKDSILKLINRADKCLYAAKADGKNNIKSEKI